MNIEPIGGGRSTAVATDRSDSALEVPFKSSCDGEDSSHRAGMVERSSSVLRRQSADAKKMASVMPLVGGGRSCNYDEIDAGAEIQMTAPGVVPDDTFTVTQAVNNLGFGKFQILLSFVIGLCWMSDSMEIMILSILSPALHCEWHISQYHQAVLTMVVFAGMMCSSAFWGKISDQFGRRKALTLSTFYLFFYGILSAFAPNYTWMAFLRFLVGFSIGCVPQSVTLFSEFLPSKQRGKCVVLLDCLWALGACIEVFLAAVIMPMGGWRWLLALSALPSFGFVVLSATWLPESARFNALTSHGDEAIETLSHIARVNGRAMPVGRLIVDDEYYYASSRGSISDLLNREFRKLTALLWSIWTGSSFIYYGVVLMTTELFETPGSHGVCSLDGALKVQCSAQCRQLDRLDYTHLLWTTLAEFPGILLTILLVDKIGRRKTMMAELLLLCISLCFLFKCSLDRTFITVILFFVRGLASGVFQAAYVYTAEVYPTSLRSVGIGSCSGMARLGAMMTPFASQVLMKASLEGAVTVYLIVGLISCLSCLMLPVETAGRDLDERHQSTKGYQQQR